MLRAKLRTAKLTEWGLETLSPIGPTTLLPDLVRCYPNIAPDCLLFYHKLLNFSVYPSIFDGVNCNVRKYKYFCFKRARLKYLRYLNNNSVMLDRESLKFLNGK